MYRDRLRELGIVIDSTGRQTCPMCSHDRKKPYDKCLSVTFSTDAVLYHCHNCEWSGSVPYKEYSKKVFIKPIAPKKENPNEEVKTFFRCRKIKPEVLNKYKIGFNGKEIIFPYYKNNELVNVKYRTIDKHFRQEKDTEKTLFGMDNVDINKPLIIVEGEMDVLALASQDIYAVSIPNGGNDKELDCIENCYDFIQKFNTYIIAVDNDEVGNKLKNNLLNRFGKENCKLVNWNKYKDANDALINNENLSEYINNATIINPDGVITYEDQYDQIYKDMFEEDNEYYPTGWTEFDKLVKVRTGYLMIVTGYPSRGKSTFVTNLLVNLSKKYNFKHLIASFESTTSSSYIELLEMYKNKSIELIKASGENIFCEFKNISEHFFRLDTDRQWTIDEIIEKSEIMVKKHGIKTLVIDPYNRLKNEFKDREDRYVGSILSKLCMIAKKLNILVIFVAHPKKTDDDDEIPSMYSISGSGDWYNMADYGIIVHRERNSCLELSNDPKIIIGKVKNYLLGKPSGGEITLHYDINKRVLLNKRGE